MVGLNKQVMDFNSIMDIIMFGKEKYGRDRHHRFGDSIYFRFITFQIFRTGFIGITLFSLFVMLYLDGRLCVLLL